MVQAAPGHLLVIGFPLAQCLFDPPTVERASVSAACRAVISMMGALPARLSANGADVLLPGVRSDRLPMRGNTDAGAMFHTTAKWSRDG
jgi:hypothetical protein